MANGQGGHAFTTPWHGALHVGRRSPPIPSARGAPIATTVIYDDARIRVWESVTEPGGNVGAHSHDAPYWLCRAAGDVVTAWLLDHGGQAIPESIASRVNGKPDRVGVGT